MTKLRLSLRVPPSTDPIAIARAMKQVLEDDPPYGTRVTFQLIAASPGWVVESLALKLERALAVFGLPPMFHGVWTSIPMTRYLQDIWPDADVIVSGASVMGAGHAHGYDENIDLKFVRKWTVFMAGMLAAC
jgi:acetylornithine deacetylase/succinyl-diaminopimelate desuccinylase-like protein